MKKKSPTESDTLFARFKKANEVIFNLNDDMKTSKMRKHFWKMHSSAQSTFNEFWTAASSQSQRSLYMQEQREAFSRGLEY
mmetsp:Transcript_36684/g.42206  ORF Transcript_36684/g.42206 Transcript_36684/m.42206 type:complete len:81 (+) Transcript_36684:10-252(+)